MNNNIKIAKELIRMAKQLIEARPTGTHDEFNKLSEDNIQKYIKDVSDDFPWDLFETKEEVENFIKQKKEQHPKLSEVISNDTLEKLLNEGWFCIVSAGVNPDEDDECKVRATDKDGIFDKNVYKQLKHEIVDKRYEDLCKFLDGLKVPYYEIIGQYNGVAEKSYIVDLTDIGKNNKEEAKNIFREIRSFCNQIKQESIVEGVGNQQALVYCKDGSYRKRIDDKGDFNDAMSQTYYELHNRTNNRTWSGNFGDFNDKTQVHHSDWLDTI